MLHQNQSQKSGIMIISDVDLGGFKSYSGVKNSGSIWLSPADSSVQFLSNAPWRKTHSLTLQPEMNGDVSWWCFTGINGMMGYCIRIILGYITNNTGGIVGCFIWTRGLASTFASCPKRRLRRTGNLKILGTCYGSSPRWQFIWFFSVRIKCFASKRLPTFGSTSLAALEWCHTASRVQCNNNQQPTTNQNISEKNHCKKYNNKATQVKLFKDSSGDRKKLVSSLKRA